MCACSWTRREGEKERNWLCVCERRWEETRNPLARERDGRERERERAAGRNKQIDISLPRTPSPSVRSGFGAKETPPRSREICLFASCNTQTITLYFIRCSLFSFWRLICVKRMHCLSSIMCRVFWGTILCRISLFSPSPPADHENVKRVCLHSATRSCDGEENELLGNKCISSSLMGMCDAALSSHLSGLLSLPCQTCKRHVRIALLSDPRSLLIPACHAPSFDTSRHTCFSL